MATSIADSKSVLAANVKVAGSYIGWVGYGNMGDEAMWMVCQRRFDRVEWSIQREREDRSLRGTLKRMLGSREKESSYTTAILGGGTIVNCGEVGLSLYRDARRQVGKPVPVFGSGIYMPGASSNIANWCDRRAEWVSLFEELPVIGVRGPESKALLEEAGAKNVIISGDPAVMFHRPLGDEHKYPTQAKERLEWGTRRATQPLRIGINAGGMKGIEYGDVDGINAAFVRTIDALLGRGHEVEMFSIWEPDHSVCDQVAKRCAGAVRVEERSVVDPDEYLKFVERYDLVIALKLHAGILALAANVPAIMIEYQRKTHDFAASLGWEEYSVRGDQVGGDRLAELSLGALDRVERLRGDVCEKMCALKARFEAYCTQIEPLLYGSSGR